MHRDAPQARSICTAMAQGDEGSGDGQIVAATGLIGVVRRPGTRMANPRSPTRVRASSDTARRGIAPLDGMVGSQGPLPCRRSSAATVASPLRRWRVGIARRSARSAFSGGHRNRSGRVKRRRLTAHPPAASMMPAANVVAEPDSAGQIDVFRPGDFDAHPSSLLQPHGAAPVPVVS